MRTTFSLNFLEYPRKVYRPKGRVWLVFLSLKTKFVAGDQVLVLDLIILYLILKSFFVSTSRVDSHSDHYIS